METILIGPLLALLATLFVAWLVVQDGMLTMLVLRVGAWIAGVNAIYWYGTPLAWAFAIGTFVLTGYGLYLVYRLFSGRSADA
jgi:hypothetical protein